MKLLPHILFEKHVYILALEMAKPRNNHCANYIGTLSFPMYRPVALVHLLSLAFLAALTLLVDAREVTDDDEHWRRQGGPGVPGPPMAGQNFFFVK